jgi:hypothetical protein
LFAWNNHQTVGGNLLSILSRFTWQAPQEALGFGAAVVENHAGLVNKVGYFDGATVLNTTFLVNSTIQLDAFGNQTNGAGHHSGSAFTLGNYINLPSNAVASPNDPTFVHEYGRYLQSRAEGFVYLGYTAIPNLFGGGNDDKTSRDANARSLIYFNKNYGPVTYGNTLGAFSWYLAPTQGDPITGYNPNRPFDDPQNQAALKNNMRNFW